MYKKLGVLGTTMPFLPRVNFSLALPFSWLVLPSSQEGDVNSYVRNCDPLGHIALSAFTLQVVASLDYLHTKAHYVDLDINPRNILWRSCDNNAFIVDFGLAEPWPLAGPHRHTTGANYVTQQYRPPELWCTPGSHFDAVRY